MAASALRALTLVEILVVLALVAVVAVFAVVVAGRGGSAARSATEVAAAIRQARWAAVVEGRPVVLLALGGDVVRTLGGTFSCDATGPTKVVWEGRPLVRVAWPRLGVAFAADGRPRRCDGSGAGNTTVAVVDRDGVRAAVVIAITGRVRWERR